MTKLKSIGKRKSIVFIFATIALVAAGAFYLLKQPSSDPMLEVQLASHVKSLAGDLEVPWQMRWLPPNKILFTEISGSIKSLDIDNQKIETLYRVQNVAREIQAGALGLALHPNFQEHSQVFVSYNYYDAEEIKLRVDLLQFADDTLQYSKTIIDSIPSFAISIGGRIVTTRDQKILLTVGEGAYSEHAQEPKALQGKILRYNLDGSIPADNPSSNSPVWSRGFRNPQGICIGPKAIYASEHGTFSNDELNLIVQDDNYGWPLQSGICTDSNCLELGYQDPLVAWTPTVAPSGMDFYVGNNYPFLEDHLLVACLKGQKVLCLKLSDDGTKVMEEKSLLVNKVGRIRDVLVNPSGRVFVSTSNSDVYGSNPLGGDQIFEIFPSDSLIPVNQHEISPPAVLTLDSTNLAVSVKAKNLRLPWDLNWVKGGKIWFNERGGAIKELTLSSGTVKLIHMVPNVFESNDNSGMHGFAVHPNFPEEPYFYCHYTFELYKSRLERFEVDTSTMKVRGSDIFLPELEGNKSHNGSRIVFGPDGHIYFCIGDGYKRRAAQKLERTNGKILRLNADGTIPEDNPFPKSYVYSIGHRNPQGLAWASNGMLYSSEHGSSNDDEINCIEAGANYGFPNVQGPCDERSEKRFCDKYRVVEPLYSWTPTIGPSGIDHYGHNAIPEWKNSLLITTLKSGDGIEGQRLLVAKLDESGKKVSEINEFLTYSFGRLRDVMVAPDGRVFLCTSNRESNQNAKQVVQEEDDRIIELKPINHSPAI